MTSYLLGGLIAFVTTYFWKDIIIDLLYETDMVRENYLHHKIPLGVGIAILLSTLSASFFILFTTQQPMLFFIYLFGIAVVGFSGIIDDMIGTHKVKGFRGHMGSLIHGVLTTGGLKAIVGGLASLLIAFWISNTWSEKIVHGFILVLSINMINLFDVRPGRASKVFLASIFFIWIFSSAPNRFISALAVGSVLGMVGGDLKGHYMMGDIGSNILGFTVGISICLLSSLYSKLLILLIYILLQITAEKISISSVIQKYRFLRFLDALGTTKKPLP